MAFLTQQGRLKISGSKDETSLSIAFFQLSHLLKAGVAIDHCLGEIIEQETSWKLRRVWRDIAHYVNDGQPLSVSMARWPDVFSATLQALVQSGEASAQLAQACGECRQLLVWRQEVRTRINTALFYPLFTGVLVLAVVGFLMIYLVPALSGFLDISDPDIPWHTLVLLMISDWLRQYMIFATALGGLLVMLLWMCYRSSQSLRLVFDRQCLKLPLVGRLLVGVALSRYCENCARLYGRGIALGTAMRISEGVVDNSFLRQSLEQARLLVRSGSSFSVSMSAITQLPDVLIRMLRAGDAAGQLQQSLIQASLQQKQLVDTRIDRIETLLGPALLVFVGTALLWIVLSLLGPIYESAIQAVINT